MSIEEPAFSPSPSDSGLTITPSDQVFIFFCNINIFRKRRRVGTDTGPMFTLASCPVTFPLKKCQLAMSVASLEIGFSLR